VSIEASLTFKVRYTQQHIYLILRPMVLRVSYSYVFLIRVSDMRILHKLEERALISVGAWAY
jgi:hypothetical protein